MLQKLIVPLCDPFESVESSRHCKRRSCDLLISFHEFSRCGQLWSLFDSGSAVVAPSQWRFFCLAMAGPATPRGQTPSVSEPPAIVRVEGGLVLVNIVHLIRIRGETMTHEVQPGNDVPGVESDANASAASL